MPDDDVSTADRQSAERHEELRQLRNMLAVIRSIVRRTGDEVDTVDDYRALLDGRLAAYLHVQAALAQNRALGLDLETMVLDELLRFNIRLTDEVEVRGPSVRLNSDAAGLAALIFHEAALASASATAPSTDGAELALSVTWQATGDNLLLRWEDRHSSIAGSPPWSAWIGQAIAHQLSGRLEEDDREGRHVRTICLPSDCFAMVAPTD